MKINELNGSKIWQFVVQYLETLTVWTSLGNHQKSCQITIYIGLTSFSWAVPSSDKTGLARQAEAGFREAINELGCSNWARYPTTHTVRCPTYSVHNENKANSVLLSGSLDWAWRQFIQSDQYRATHEMFLNICAFLFVSKIINFAGFWNFHIFFKPFTI